MPDSNQSDDNPTISLPNALVAALGDAAAVLQRAQVLVPQNDTLAISDLDSAQQLIAKTQARYRDA